MCQTISTIVLIPQPFTSKSQASDAITMVLNVFINYEAMFGKVICGGLRQKDMYCLLTEFPWPICNNGLAKTSSILRLDWEINLDRSYDVISTIKKPLVTFNQIADLFFKKMHLKLKKVVQSPMCSRHQESNEQSIHRHVLPSRWRRSDPLNH